MALIGSIIGDIIGSQYEFPNQRPDDVGLNDECFIRYNSNGYFEYYTPERKD